MTSTTDRWNELTKSLPEPDPESPINSLAVPQGSPLLDNMIILPGNGVTITECAEKIFTRIAETETMFQRGGAIMEVSPDSCGPLHLTAMSPAAFRSRIEKFGTTFAWRSGANKERVLKPTVCPEEIAKALMASDAAQRLLPPISMITDCPVVIEDGAGVTVLGKGYHRAHSGILVTAGEARPLVHPGAAVLFLKQLLREFLFQSPGDYARGFAMLLTPALKMGGIIKGHIPMPVFEADLSQAGKTYFAELIAALYNDHPSIVPLRRGGVGSVDESFSHEVMKGKPFILFDNFRGKLDSTYIEAFLTATGTFSARVPHLGHVQVDPTRSVLMMSSNGIEMTPDLANRCCIIRIRKREGYTFMSYPQGDLIQFVQANQKMLLGCVFSLIAEWIKCGKPTTSVADHDFREWAGTLDWFVQVANLGPLLADHRNAQVRVSNPARTMLRKIALALQAMGRLGEPYTASDLCALCVDAAIEIPGLSTNDSDHAARHFGCLMTRVFGKKDTITVESYEVCRASAPAERKGEGSYPAKIYRFNTATMATR